MLLYLNMEGIAASSGSACTSGSLEPSHVLLAMGIPHELAHGNLRITLGKDNTEEDVDYFLEKLVPIVEKLWIFHPLVRRTKPACESIIRVNPNKEKPSLRRTGTYLVSHVKQ